MTVVFRFEVDGGEKVAFDFVAGEDRTAAACHLRLGEKVGHPSGVDRLVLDTFFY